MSAVVQDLKRAASVLPEVRLIRGDTVTLEPVRWLWRDFLPAGMFTILGGAPGCGKTTIALSLAATITYGGFWPDGTRCAQPADVIVWSGEDPPAVLSARLAASGADMKRVHFVDGVTGEDGGPFDPAHDMALLEATLERLPAPRLLILDPIVSAVSGDSHENAKVRRSLQPVVDLAQRLGCAVLGITHFTKGTAGRDPAERVTGSVAFVAQARVVLVAAKVKPQPGDEEEEPTRVLVRAKSNIGPDDGGFSYALEREIVAPDVEGQRVRWLQALQGSARDVLAEAEADVDADDAADVAGFLRGLLADGPVSAKVVKADSDGAGYAWRTVQRAAQRLGVERRKEGMKGGWVWALGMAPKASRISEGATEDAEGAEGATHKWAASSRDRASEGVSPKGMAPSASSAPSAVVVAPSGNAVAPLSAAGATEAPNGDDVEVL